jgi:hypothetical protein
MKERTGAPPEITSEADIVAGGAGEVLRALLTEKPEECGRVP